MIGRLNHVAIAVKDLDKAVATYRNALGAVISEPQAEPDHGVTVVFVTLPNTKIEFLEPLGENSPIAKFLEKNPDGGIHHVCYEVDDIIAARNQLKAQGARVLGDGEPKIGAHGKPVLFLHQGFSRNTDGVGAGVRSLGTSFWCWFPVLVGDCFGVTATLALMNSSLQLGFHSQILSQGSQP